MIRYWTLWNSLWWATTELNNHSYSDALCNSIMTTSMMGFFLTWIHPKKIKLVSSIPIRFQWKVPRSIHIVGDVILHHTPLIFMLYRLSHKSNKRGSGLGIFVPAGIFVCINRLRNTNFKKAYGIDDNLLCLSSSVLAVISGQILKKISNFFVSGAASK